ncbi:hypothetical protein PQQ75_32405 [Paraburkholderia aspalathi]|uniref:hypothetical protein n=1 Tax=Paraburkholderia aspalathi TaxID=1324617 RepID=UPI0038B9B3DB
MTFSDIAKKVAHVTISTALSALPGAALMKENLKQTFKRARIERNCAPYSPAEFPSALPPSCADALTVGNPADLP